MYSWRWRDAPGGGCCCGPGAAHTLLLHTHGAARPPSLHYRDLDQPPERLYQEQLQGEQLQGLQQGVPPPMFPHNLESARDVCMLGSKLKYIVSGLAARPAACSCA
jgi:hypothetical protein